MAAAGPAPLTIFERIVNKEIPAKIIYEDDKCLAFNDVIPKVKGRLTQISKAEPADAMLLGHLFFVAGQVAKQQGLGESGFRIIVNDGRDAGQTVFHLHLHVMGGRAMVWPAG